MKELENKTVEFRCRMRGRHYEAMAKLCAEIEWFKDYGVAILVGILVLAGLIFGIWCIVDADHKLDERYRYQIKVNHARSYDMYRTNSYTIGDDYIEFYIKDDPERHMIVVKGNNITITDHLNKEEDK